MKVEKYKDSRFYALHDSDGELVAVTVYKKGAENVKTIIKGLCRELG